MAEHHDEMEQIEALKRWWHENRAFVTAGLVIGVAVVGGWRGWEWHQHRQSEAAGALYEELLGATQAGDLAKAGPMATRLTTEFARTPYAANGALQIAKLAYEQGDKAGARGWLEWAAANAADAEVMVLAKIRLARVLTAEGDAKRASEMLAALDAGAFAALAQDALGDALAATGDVEGARKAWTAALDASSGNRGDTALIKLKLESLGPAAAPASTAGTTP